MSTDRHRFGSGQAPATVSDDLWGPLRTLTDARIGLARSGASLSTPALLAFRLAHARARDAVSAEQDAPALQSELAALGQAAIECTSAAPDLRTYLLRPDLGRALDPDSLARLRTERGDADLSIVLVDGLSARAVQQHALPLLRVLLPLLDAAAWTLSPMVILRHGRVAAGDVVGEALRAKCVLVLIGERPGLSSPDSMGAYMTWAPAPGVSDADRNCVSNIRPAGLSAALAAQKLMYLLGRMRTLSASGVALKDEMSPQISETNPRAIDDYE